MLEYELPSSLILLFLYRLTQPEPSFKGLFSLNEIENLSHGDGECNKGEVMNRDRADRNPVGRGE